MHCSAETLLLIRTVLSCTWFFPVLALAQCKSGKMCEKWRWREMPWGGCHLGCCLMPPPGLECFWEPCRRSLLLSWWLQPTSSMQGCWWTPVNLPSHFQWHTRAVQKVQWPRKGRAARVQIHECTYERWALKSAGRGSVWPAASRTESSRHGVYGAPARLYPGRCFQNLAFYNPQRWYLLAKWCNRAEWQ